MATPDSAPSPSINDSWSDTWETVRQFSLNIISSCEVLISEEHPKIEQIINIFHKALQILLLVNSSSKEIYNGDTLLSTFSRPPEVSPIDIQNTSNPLTPPIVSSNIPPISPLLQRVQLHVSQQQQQQQQQQQYYQGTFTTPLPIPHFTTPQIERPFGTTTRESATPATNPSSTSPHQPPHNPLLQSLDPLRILVSSLYDIMNLNLNQSRNNQNFAINSSNHINPLLHPYSPQLPNLNMFSQSPNMLSPQFIPQVMFPSSRDQGLKMPPSQHPFPKPHTLLGLPDTPPPMREFTIISESGSSSPKRKRRSRAPAPDLEGLFCHSCGETQTSQWRRGPDGRKSLCNACGIRFANMVNREKSVPMKDTQISVDMLLNRPNSSTTTETPLSAKPSRLLNEDTAENSSSGSISPRGGHSLRRGAKAGGRGLIKSSSSSNLVMKANKPEIPRSNSGSNIVGTTTPTEVSLLKRDSSFSRFPLSPLLSLSIKENSEEGLSDLAEAIAVSTSPLPPQTTVHKKSTTDQSTQRSSTPLSTHSPSSPSGSPTQNPL